MRCLLASNNQLRICGNVGRRGDRDGRLALASEEKQSLSSRESTETHRSRFISIRVRQAFARRDNDVSIAPSNEQGEAK
jgi:hypothetical protein